MSPKLLPLTAALLSLSGGCAHAASPGAVEPGAPTVEWPSAPERPRVRLEQVLTVAVPRAATRSWWRTLLAVVTGAEGDESRDVRFARPFGVAFTQGQALLVTDSDAPAVLRFGRSGAFEAELTCPDLPWLAPMGLAASAIGDVFVADGGRGVVVRWTPGGCTAIGGGELVRPTGVALSGDRLFVADPPSHRVVAFSTAGVRIGAWGARGAEPGQFNFPTDVTVAPDGTIWVVDALNFRIAHLSAEGGWLGTVGQAGDTGGGLARPKGVHIDAGQRVYVSDAQRDVVVVFKVDGTLDYVLGAPGAERGHFAHPAGIDVQDDRLVVADSQNRRVQVFEILGERT
jgi:DNA-binding beta-propeller fold protein YncE